ncbi:MAG: type II secretion system protein GspG [Gemmatimonadota bacterium]
MPESDVGAARRQVEADYAELSSFLEENWTAADAPTSIFDVRAAWEERYPDRAFPTDPFDGYDYGYTRVGASYELLSSGPDGEPGTDDDILQVREFPR